MIDHDLYIFVVDTDKYSDNFEQELCAHMTGMPPVCSGRTDAYAQAYRDEMGIQDDEDYNDHIVHVDDERGQCSIWPTPGWFNDGMGNHYREGSISDKDVQRKYEAERKTRFMDNEQFSKHPAYQSVAIFMDRRPTDKEIQVMIDRARKFVHKVNPGETPTIEGFRLLLRTVNEQPLMSWPPKEDAGMRPLRQRRVEANLKTALETLAFACPFGKGDYSVDGMREYEDVVEDVKDLFRPVRDDGGTWDFELRKLVHVCETLDPAAHGCDDGCSPDEVEAECWEPYRDALRAAKALLGDSPA